MAMLSGFASCAVIVLQGEASLAHIFVYHQVICCCAYSLTCFVHQVVTDCVDF
jgi:hypothetical protein